MPHGSTQTSDDALAILVDVVHEQLQLLPGNDRRGYLGSDLPAVSRALARIQSEQLAGGSVFCDWGSGLGEVCAVAALHGFTSVGIEIQTELVAAARVLASKLGLAMTFAEGTYLQRGDDEFAIAGGHSELAFNSDAWDELGLSPADCHIVFAYPWPEEEALIDDTFLRHASPGALLVTLHADDRVLVQRKVADCPDLVTVGWM
jgi:hypothetical protein